MSSDSYGYWPSPLTSEYVSSASGIFYELVSYPRGLYWTLSKPQEKGRHALFHWDGTQIVEIDGGISARTQVHEYGGGALLAIDNELYFINQNDQSINVLKEGKIDLLYKEEKCRFADMTVRPQRDGLIAVKEIHGEDKVDNQLVWIDLKTPGKSHVLAKGNDFYAHPRLSPDGLSLAWITWDHPHMPWDETKLWVAQFNSATRLCRVQLVAGSKGESVLQPAWSPDGKLYYLCDRSGWWNLYCDQKQICPIQADCTLPPWILARSSYVFCLDGDEWVIGTIYTQEGIDHLALLKEGRWQKIDLPFTMMRNLTAIDDRLYLIGSAPTHPFSIIQVDIKNGEWRVIECSQPSFPFPDFLVAPKTLTFPSTHGRPTHAIYYPPHNPQVKSKEKTPPPAIIRLHGGPTAHAQMSWSSDILFWTSRGFAFVDLNYAGSSGYGREYRRSLYSLWGVADVEDLTSCAHYLAGIELADPSLIFIRGGSSGGFTVLSALWQSTLFAGGVSFYGVANLITLAEATHKFEERYLDTLIGPYPEALTLYQNRSPVNHAAQIQTPLLLLQGGLDTVVPPSQAEAIYHAMKSQKREVSYILFEQESHGFRMQSSIQKSFEAELKFYLKIITR